MGNSVEPREWRLTALTDIWTGGVEGRPARLIPTGLMGSIRWWFEVLVRGLGGSACDPTEPNVRCPDRSKEPHKPGHRCVVCELFGCTGWARKFRLMVLDEDVHVIQNKIQAGQSFILRFIPLRSIRDEEWWLLDATLRLIAEYGAIGGKTVFKPSEESTQTKKQQHQDFGLVQYVAGPADWQCTKTFEDIRAHVAANDWRKIDGRHFCWASLQHFWCVKGRYLARQDANRSSFNFVTGRPEPKQHSSQGDSWLAGRRASRNVEPESKKVFSFKEPEKARRTFGFVQDENEGFCQILARLKILKDGDGNGRKPDPVWAAFNPDREFIRGKQILQRLFQKGESA